MDYDEIARKYGGAPSSDLDALARQYGGVPTAPAKPSTERTFGQAALDIPAAALSGLGSLLQFPGQVVKMLPGLTGAGEFLEKPGELVAEAGDYLKSEGLKAREALRNKAISEAEKDGILSAFGTAIVSTIKDPALITTFLAEQVPLLLGPAGAAKLVQKLGAKSIETAGAGLTGDAAKEAVKVASEKLSKKAYGAAYGTGSAMQAADVSSDAYEEALRKAREMNIPEEEAQARALAAGRIAGLGAGAVSLLAQRLPGAKAIEQRLAGVPGTAGKLGAAVGEGISEAIEEGGGQVFKNIGLRQIDPNQSLTEGVGGAAGLGALGGGTLGGILGKKAEEARFEGQREGESDREFAARLQREIQQGIRPPAPPPAPPKIPTDQQLFTLAAQPNGYGLLENLKQRLDGDQTIPEADRKAAIDNIASIQERMTTEEIARKRVTPGAEERFLRPEILTSEQLFDMAAQEGGYGQLESYKQNLLQVKQDAEIKNTIREIEDLQRRMNIEQAQRLIPGAPAPTLEAQAPAAPAAPQLLTTNELFDMASKNDYGGIEQYKQGLKQERQTPEVRKAIEDAEFVQRRMNVERIQPSVSSYFEGKDLNNQEDVDAIAKSLYSELKRKDLAPERERQVRTALDVFVNSLPETVEAPPMPDWAVEVPEKRKFPKAEEAKAEEAFRKEIEKKIREVEADSRKLARESKSLFAILKGTLNPKEVFDISPDRRVAGLKRKGAGGVSLDFFVDSGRLDAFLPPDMRHNAAQFDSTASQEYIKDLIRQGVYITFDARMEIEKNQNSVQQMEKLLMEFNTDELNALLQEASDEQRAEEGIAEEVQGAAPEGEGRVAEEGVGAPPAGEVKPEEVVKKSLAEVTKNVPEAKFRELEGKAKAPQEAEQAPAEEVKAEEPAKEKKPREITPEIQKKIDILEKVLRKNLAKFGLKDVDLNLEQGMTDEGSFSGQLIRIALDSPDPLGILRHESIHALKEAGFFTDKQWASLEKAADEKWIDQFLKGQQVEYEGQRMSRFDAYMKEYGGNMALIREEAIADAFRSFSKKKPAGLMGALTERMKNFFKAVKSAFNSQGIESAEDIFGKIEEGKLEAAPAKETTAKEVKSSLRAHRDLFERADEIPMSEGVEAIRDDWVGGVAGVGNRDSMYELFRIEGGPEYTGEVQKFLRNNLGENFKGYRLMSQDEFEELTTGSMGSQFVSFSLNPDVAKGFKNLPAYAKRKDLVVVEMDLTPEHVHMIGHPGEQELVVDYGQGYNPAEIKVVEGDVALKSLRAPDTEAFKNWFGDSKVVDENGEPLVVYHGTTKDFTSFDREKATEGRFGAGFYFGGPTTASRRADVEGGRVLPVYLNISNPAPDEVWSDLRDKMYSGKISGEKMRSSLEEQGYDGIILRLAGGSSQYVAFRPEQIKSATGNIGTFEPTSPDIRKSLRTPTDNIVDLTQRRAEQLIAEEAEDTKDLNKQAQIRQRREDLRFLTDEASPFFKSIANQAQIAEDVYRMAPVVKTDIGPALNSYDRMWRNYTTGVYGNDSNMYRSSPDSAFTAVSNLREDLKSADKVKSDITAYLKEATKYANGLSDGKTGEKDLKKELLEVLNRPVVQVKFSMRSIPVLSSADQARINDTVRPRHRPGFVERMIDAISGKTFSYFREQIINEYNEIAELDKRVAAQIRAMGGAEQLADDRAETACLFSSQASAVAAAAMGSHTRKGGIPVYRNGIVTVDRSGDNEGIVEIFAPLASTGNPRTFQDYQFWASVNRAKKYILNPGQTRYVEKLFNQNDIEIANQLEREYAAMGINFADIRSRWLKYNGGLVKLMRDTGTISARAAREFMEHADYFPFYRQINEEEMTGPKTFSTIAGTKPPKAAKGSEEALGDFFETVVRNTQAAISLAMKNVAGQRVTAQALRINEVVRLSDNPQIVQTGANTWDVYDFQYADTISAPDQASALSVARNRYGANATVSASQTRTGQWDLFTQVKIGDVGGADAQEAREEAFANHKYRPDVSVYKVFENGQPVYYRANDIKLINALKALNTTDLPFLGLLSAPANLLRTLVTKDPGYMLVNQMRDSLSAWATTGVKLTPIADSARQFARSMVKETPEMEAIIDGGVIGGYEYAHGTKEGGVHLEKQLRKKAGVKTISEVATSPFTSLWGALERGTQISDGATRAEVYKRVLAETGNEAEALWQAAEVLNFYRHGRSPVIRVLTAIVPFLNSRIQGLDVLYRAGINPILDKNATESQKKRMKTFWVRGMTMFALSSMYWLMTHDDDEYKKQEQETKDNYWLIPSLGIKIAIPFEVGVIFKVLPERILANLYGQDTGKETMESLKRQLQSTFMFTLIPQALLPYYEVSTNKSFFTQRPIIGKGMEGVAPRFQVAPGTSSFAQVLAEKLRIETTSDSSSFTKALAKQLDVSPIAMDHIIKGYTGTLGQYAVEVFDAIYNLNNDVPKPSKRFEQLPIIKRLALDPDARGNVTAFYDLKNSVDEVVRTSNLLTRSMNFKEWGPYMSANFKMLATQDYVNDLEKSMSEYRDMKRMVQASGMSPDSKRDTILAIEKMENSLSKNIQTFRKAVQE